MKSTKISQQKAVTILRFLYPIWAIVGMFSIMYVPSKLIVLTDATTTASNILSNELLFRLSIVGSLFTQLIFIIAVLLLYKLFKTVNKDYSRLMVIFALVGVPIAMLNTLNSIAALQLLNNPELMMFFLDLNFHGIMIATIFWGLWLFPLGYLIYKSGYFPKIIGISVILAGFGYLLDSLIHFIIPNYKTIFSPIVGILTFGEMIFILWIIIMGAKIPKISTKSSNPK